jgi:hypothetical protein
LAILDPCHHFLNGGASVDLTQHPDIDDHLLAFESLRSVEDLDVKKSFNGTIIRLPLRTATIAASEASIRSSRTLPSDIVNLMKKFVDVELSQVLLFLLHVRSVELQVIDDKDHITIGKATRVTSNNKEVIDIQKSDETISSQTWWLTRYPSNDSVNELLSDHLGPDVNINIILAEKKLHSEIALAFPIDGEPLRGQLFSYLPLPIFTDFPCHIHAVFALGPERQYLVNPDEKGVIPLSHQQ